MNELEARRESAWNFIQKGFLKLEEEDKKAAQSLIGYGVGMLAAYQDEIDLQALLCEIDASYSFHMKKRRENK